MCIVRRQAHCLIFGICIGYFNHRYYLVALFYGFIYFANSVAVNFIFYGRMLSNYGRNVKDSHYYYDDETTNSCCDDEISNNYVFFYIFLVSAFIDFYCLIVSIMMLTIETETLITGRMPNEGRSVGLNYQNNVKKNVICILGKSWYLTCVFPTIKSKLPDLPAVFITANEQPSPCRMRQRCPTSKIVTNFALSAN